MVNSIDWGFIGRMEGAGVTKGYVPNPNGSQSGVTVATGFDLGQRTAAEIRAMGLPSDLTVKLLPYVGLKGGRALAYLKQSPLVLSPDEVAAIDGASQSLFATRLAAIYDAAIEADAGLQLYEGLFSAAQTVIASVAFQYGLSLNRRAPHFWSAVTNQDWPATINELRNFGDAYATRRNAEADLLAAGLPKPAAADATT